MPSIADAYREQDPQLRPFYARGIRELFEVPPLPRPWAPELVHGITRYQAALGVERHVTGTESVVVTGQQPALLTGPLYTIYKAITAIHLSRRLTQDHGTPHIPVYWIGSDDHDFEEARSATLLARSHTPVTLRYEPQNFLEGSPLYRVAVEDSLHEIIDRAANEAAGSEYTEEIRAFLHESLAQSRTFPEWTARILARLFRDTPLLFFEPCLPESRSLSRPVLRKEIEQPLESTRLLNEAGRRIAALGYQPQLIKGADECNFFLEVNGRRRKVLYKDGAFVAPEERLTYAKDALLELLEAHPDRFSPNVALRCVVQQALFPAVAYVAGPGEVAYWAQLKPVFAFFEEPMPVVYPRAAAVLYSTKVRQLMTRLGISLEDLRGDQELLVPRALEAGPRSPALQILKDHTPPILDAVSCLEDALERSGRSAVFAREHAERFAQRARAELEHLERIFLYEDAAKVAAVSKQIQRLCSTLAPARKPQERVYSIFSYLFEHGWDLVARLIGALDSDSFRMNEVEL